MAPRFEDRHSYISVGLRYRFDDHWHPLRAFGWNAKGFNFYSHHHIVDDHLMLKRGLSNFDGSIAWRATESDNEGVLAMLVNELLFQKAREVSADKALHTRLVRLIRAPMLVSEKRRVLESLGVHTDDATLGPLVDQRKREEHLFRYGVKVDSPIWRRVVEDALSVSSVVASLENMSAALSRR